MTQEDILRNIKESKEPISIEDLAKKMGKVKTRQVIDIDQDFKDEVWNLIGMNLIDFDSQWRVSVAETKDA